MSLLDRLVSLRNDSVEIIDGIAFRLGHTTTLPTCDYARQGQWRMLRGGVGVADRIVVCEKDSTEAYAWQEKGSAGIIPVGTMWAWSFQVAPVGWLLAEGQAILRSTSLGALLVADGMKYGTGNGTTTVNVPNGRGRVLAGLDATVTAFNAIGKTGGVTDVTLSAAESGLPAHSTGNDTPDHSHGYVRGQYSFGSASNTTAGGGFARLTSVADISPTLSSGGASARHTHPVAGAAASAAHNNLQPYLTIGGWIIKL